MKKRSRARLLLLLPVVPCMLATSSCGSSSSETPWPAEPESPALGPSGESSRADPSDLEAPDGGN
jgi:hypothetical protein